MKRMLIAASVAGAIAAPFTGSSAESVDVSSSYADSNAAPQEALDTLRMPLGNCALLPHFELPQEKEPRVSRDFAEIPGSAALQGAGVWTLLGGGWLRRKVRNIVDEAMVPLDAASDKLTELEQSVSRLIVAIDQTRSAQADTNHTQTEATIKAPVDISSEQPS